MLHAVFTDYRPWGSFPKGMRSPGSWSTCFHRSCASKNHGCVLGQWPSQSCLPESVCVSIKICCNRGIFSPHMCDVKKITLDPAMKGLSRFTNILLATPPACDQIYHTGGLAGGPCVTLNCSPVIWLENTSVVNSIWQVLHLGALHRRLPGFSYEVDVKEAWTRRSFGFFKRRKAIRGGNENVLHSTTVYRLLMPKYPEGLLVQSSLTWTSYKVPGNCPCGAARCKTCPILFTTNVFSIHITGEHFEMKARTSCKSSSVIYLITCRRYG